MWKKNVPIFQWNFERLKTNFLQIFVFFFCNVFYESTTYAMSLHVQFFMQISMLWLGDLYES